jgi:hypothetical protein
MNTKIFCDCNGRQRLATAALRPLDADSAKRARAVFASILDRDIWIDGLPFKASCPRALEHWLNAGPRSEEEAKLFKGVSPEEEALFWYWADAIMRVAYVNFHYVLGPHEAPNRMEEVLGGYERHETDWYWCSGWTVGDLWWHGPTPGLIALARPSSRLEA